MIKRLLFLEFAAYHPEISKTKSVTPDEFPRYLNVSNRFSTGLDTFSLDGLLLLDFSIIRNPFLSNYGHQGFDYLELKKADKKYQSRVVFMDTSGDESFVLQINPVYSTITLKSYYKKVI